TPHFVYKAGSPTIVKRRYVDDKVHKLIEIYEMDDSLLAGANEDVFCAELKAQLADHDVAVVADFGHGLITNRGVDILSGAPTFLAVNTQINAANRGFHTISKYSRADYISLHEGEIRLDKRSREAD